MWIVHVALRRPYTFICAAILVLIAGLVAIITTPVDIFPAIPLPVATVIWQYQGMSPEEMEQRVVTIVERSYSATVNDIEHIESQSLDGVAVIKVFFQPTADVARARLYAKGLSPADVSAAINAENVILPAGSARLGSREYSVRLNSSPEVVQQLNDMPIKQVNGAMVYIRDVAYVRDGAGVQTNIVRQNGQHGTYMSVLKNGSASSLAVVNRVKALLAALKPALPSSLDIRLLVDQSL